MDQVITAAIPQVIAILQAVKVFDGNMGPNPATWVGNFPGAKLQLMGAILSQLPAFGISEGAALEHDVSVQVDSWIEQLQALQTPATKAP
jgi:hypothetical protein